jgi:hypothetical protein
MPRVSVHRVSEGKLAHKVADGFMMYTSAILFFDMLVRLTGPSELKDGVLQHPKQEYWIGLNKVSLNPTELMRSSRVVNSQYMLPLADIGAVLGAHLGRSTLALAFEAPPVPQDGEISTVRLANEIASTQGSVRALNAVKNIAVVALSVAVMTQVAPSSLRACVYILTVCPGLSSSPRKRIQSGARRHPANRSEPEEAVVQTSSSTYRVSPGDRNNPPIGIR